MRESPEGSARAFPVPVEAPPGRRQRPLRLIVFMGIVVVIVLLTAGWQLWSNQSSAGDPTVPGRPLSNPQTHLHTLAIGSDGRTLYLGTHFGLFISHDGGRSWPQSRGALAPAMITSIALAPDDPAVIAVIALPSGLGSARPGVYLSRDGGSSWQNISPPDLPAAAYPFQVVAGSGPPGHFYAFYVYAGWYETEDMGGHWRPLTSGALSAMLTPSLLTDPHNPRHLLLGGDQGLFETNDDGQRWQRLSGLNGTVLSLVAGGSQPRLMFCATDGGLYRWQEGQAQLSRLAEPSAATPVTRLAVSSDGRYLYALAGSDLWFSADAGKTWSQRAHFERSDLMTLAVSPTNPDLLYAAFFYPGSVLVSRDGGRSWQILTD